jgi:N-acetylglucosaminyl-diphospho-decaprenol L-rhamnosyltransferase
MRARNLCPAAAVLASSAVARVDVVIVSYNSREELRGCVLAVSDPMLSVVVVDNASHDGSLETIADLDVTSVPLDRNGGFATGCNAGWVRGEAPYVLFLNPDARIDPAAVGQLVSVLEADPRVGVVGPRIVGDDGSVQESWFSFSTPWSIWATALFLHRFASRSSRTTGSLPPGPRGLSGSPDWVSGACMLIRRSTLQELGGLDERFFMYCEDMDICYRVRGLGFDVRYEPSASARHVGGHSAPSARLQPVLVRSRVAYARKHFSMPGRIVARVGIVAAEVTHALVSRGGRTARVGHVRGLLAALAPSQD